MPVFFYSSVRNLVSGAVHFGASYVYCTAFIHFADYYLDRVVFRKIVFFFFLKSAGCRLSMDSGYFSDALQPFRIVCSLMAVCVHPAPCMSHDGYEIPPSSCFPHTHTQRTANRSLEMKFWARKRVRERKFKVCRLKLSVSLSRLSWHIHFFSVPFCSVYGQCFSCEKSEKC